MWMEQRAFAERILLRRAAAGLSRRDLAGLSSVQEGRIVAIEAGAAQPTEAERQALEHYLQVRPSLLVEAARDAILGSVRAIGGRDVRMFGSVARGDDGPDSDVDLLVWFPADADIVTLLSLEDKLSRLLTVPVHIVSAGSASSSVRRILADSIPL